MQSIDLFTPLQVGQYKLKNRIIMAPMTRARANPDGTPSDLAAIYYAQRASAGLIFSEGIQPSFEGQGYARTPGIHTEQQIAVWQKITDAVHANGGLIFAQIMHAGRIAHPLNRQITTLPVAPSAIQAAGKMYTDQQGAVDYPTPHALEIDEIKEIIAQYRHATQCAFLAGFDGVELHNASGYLPEQFLSSKTNQRTDQYGGSIDNRVRFSLEVLEAMASVKGPEYVGIKIFPEMNFNDISDDTPLETYSYFVNELNQMNLAYLHVCAPSVTIDYHAAFRQIFTGPYFAGGGFTKESGTKTLKEERADAIVFGEKFLANPDLPERFKNSASLNEPDKNTFYTPGEKGYIDYPVL